MNLPEQIRADITDLICSKVVQKELVYDEDDLLYYLSRQVGSDIIDALYIEEGRLYIELSRYHLEQKIEDYKF